MHRSPSLPSAAAIPAPDVRERLAGRRPASQPAGPGLAAPVQAPIRPPAGPLPARKDSHRAGLDHLTFIVHG